MDGRRFYQKPWFYIFSWSVICLGFYAYQIRKLGGFAPNAVLIFIDVYIFGFGVLLWLAFFSQFVLPVRTFRDRQKIYDRLLTYLSGWRGPAIFIRDGVQIKRRGEEKRKGPGVLWLDSASAAVTRTAAAFKQTIGPGVHFTWKGEKVASVIDLHPQVQRLGPRETDNPFAPREDGHSEDKFKQVQKRRMEVSAWTRDGIEVVPNVNVVFKIDAAPAKGDQEGSRFGFDEDAVLKAVMGEGINPRASGDAPRRRVAWNRFPALIAVDIWREYLSKFTLAELFEAGQPVKEQKIPHIVPDLEDTHALHEPVAPSSGFEKTLASMLHGVNAILTRWADKCEKRDVKAAESATPPPKPSASPKSKHDQGPAYETALQAINRMVRLRMTQVEVPYMDDNGVMGDQMIESREYKLLKDRGIKVFGVGVGNLRFPPDIEDQLVRQWKTTWLKNAKEERNRVDRKRSFIELSGRVEAALQYALSLSRDLLRHQPTSAKETLKTLILRSRDELIKDGRLHRRANIEREELENLIQWVERNGS